MSSTILPQQLLPILQRQPEAERYWVALSGGLDSTVLLHLLSQLSAERNLPIYAIHVDHGISPNSAGWAAHCQQQCEMLGIELVTQRVRIERKGKGLEAAARDARYRAFAEVVGAGDMLLTAHHQDDQVETMLLQLLRGGGVRGLAGMPEFRPFDAGWLARPLLHYSREQLQRYAENNGLSWIDDPSNFDISLERNYLRHELIPQLERRHQGLRTVLARSAGHFAESASLLDELAAQDLSLLATGEKSLPIPELLLLSEARQHNLLRYWLRDRGLTVPDSRNLQRIIDEVLSAAEDAQPLVHWPGSEVRRYRDRLYAMPPLPPAPEHSLDLPWEGETLQVLPAELGELRVNRTEGEGIQADFLSGSVTVRWRRGGERIELAGRTGHHSLKKLCQEVGLPPWERERRPLIYIDGVLAQVAGLWTDSRFRCDENGVGISFEWSCAIENADENNDN
ncbi:MAG: tRNA lysidine(34) synthetase TilS [Chromatiales bacterium]|nr:tRNA lysidine(34) synthetase TilS [Chromatiales bacterium]